MASRAGATERIAMIGLGYVGLSTAVCLAARGFAVTGVDSDAGKLDTLRSGRATFREGGVQDYLRRALKKRTFMVSDDPVGTVEKADVVFITVGTPSRRDGSIDLTQIASAARSVGRGLAKGKGKKLVVVKSTVVPGTTRGKVRETLAGEAGGRNRFQLAANPEFLREGSAIMDTLSPDRVVVGADDRESGGRLVALWKRFYGGKMPVTLVTNTVNAETIKYASNAFLATKISYINEIANLCQAIPGADVTVVARGMGLDARIGARFLSAGLGFGGSCFPKDVRALVTAAKSAGAELRIAEAALETNSTQPGVAVGLARRMLGSLDGKRVALLGLAFKPDTDDMREAVSIPLVRILLKEGCEVVAYDPMATPNARRILGGRVTFAGSAKECLRGADCCIIVTEWEEFRKMRPADFSGMRNLTVIDGRRVFDPALFEGKGRFAAVGYGEELP